MAKETVSDRSRNTVKNKRRRGPVRVLKPVVFRPMDRMLHFFGRFGIDLALTVGVLFFPTPAGLSAEGHRALAAFVFTTSVLALEPVSLPVAALMVPVAEVTLGIASASEAFETFSARWYSLSWRAFSWQKPCASTG